MQFTRPVTPAEISTDLRALIRELSPDREPEYVEVQPVEGAELNECFPLVDQTVEHQGGQAVVGWSLWELPSLFAEAEFHCVWKRPDGRLLDIAPKRAECARILFLTDGRRRYEGRQVNNLRRASRSDPDLLAYLHSFDAEFELMNRGERALQHGEITLVGSDAQEFERIQGVRRQAYFQLSPQFPSVGPYHPCPCGSGKKLKWCHKVAANAV